MIVVYRDPLCIRSTGHVFYLTRYIWDFHSLRTVYEKTPDVWDIMEHGYKPWTFQADTTNPIPNDHLARFRTKLGYLYLPAPERAKASDE